MTTRYPLNHAAFTYSLSELYSFNYCLFSAKPSVKQNPAPDTDFQQGFASQSTGCIKPLKQSLLFNETLAIRLSLAWQLFAAIIQNTGDNQKNSFGFIAANNSYWGLAA